MATYQSMKRALARLMYKDTMTFNLFAGTRFAYPTHQEISVRSVREAKQNGT